MSLTSITFSDTITGKLAIPLLTIFCLVIATFLLSVEYRTQELVAQRLSARAIELADSFAVATESNTSNANFIRVVNSIGAYQDVKALFLIDDRQNKVVAASQNRYRGKQIGQLTETALRAQLNNAVELKKNLFIQDEAEHSWYVYKIQSITEDRRALRSMTLLMEVDISSSEAYIRSINIYFFSALLALLAVIALTFYILVSRYILIPVDRLMDSIRQTKKHDRPMVSMYQSSDEMGVLSKVYNDLIVDSFNKQQALSEEREKSEAAAQAKGRFLAMMTHELRTPLNGVIGMSDQLNKLISHGVQRKYLDVLRTSARQLLSIINDTLDFSKIEADKLELDVQPIVLQETINNVASMFASALADKTVSLRVILPKQKLPTVLVDEVRFSQVLINLVGNAIKFTKEGEVSITLQITSQSADNIALKVTVKDSGIGLSEQQQQKLFAEFAQADCSTTRKYGGTGLGLWICKKLVEKMQGSITVSSIPGKGAEFVIELAFEVHTGEACEADAGDTQIETDFHGQKVLVVDDTQINRMVVCAILQPLGLEFDVAENGEQAVKMHQQYQYDLILMDCLMPVMDGFDACRLIRAAEKEQNADKPVPVIALTANALEDTREQCEQAGMDEFLTKPVIPEILIKSLKTWLSSKN